MSALRHRLQSWARRARIAAAPLIVFALLAAPSVSQACSQCMATRTRENQLAFIWTTVFLSITPLLVVGGIAFWLRKKIRQADAPARAALESADAAGVPIASTH